MEEILRVADRVTVLRDGKIVDTVEKERTSLPDIIRMVVGKELTQGISRPDKVKGEELLSITGLAMENVFRDVSFSLKEGEILGIGGLVGSGRSQVARCLFGAHKHVRGDIRVAGRRVKFLTPLDAIKQGIILIPEERKTEGLILNHTVLTNLSLVLLRSICRLRIINQGKREKTAGDMAARLRIRTPSMRQDVGLLSGGNQQKVVIGKWLHLNPKICILDQPTRGIDVGAKQEIYNLIADLADRGSGVIIISDELPELIGLCDRILVMRRGVVTREFIRGQVDQKQLLSAIIGHGT
jgi:ribose transport system ATP-binding protein